MALFFFNDTATTEIYTLSLHDALPIYPVLAAATLVPVAIFAVVLWVSGREALTSSERLRRERGRLASHLADTFTRSEEHTSELQSRQYLVCRLLLEKKNS